jgi:hypothetical protein
LYPVLNLINIIQIFVSTCFCPCAKVQKQVWGRRAPDAQHNHSKNLVCASSYSSLLNKTWAKIKYANVLLQNILNDKILHIFLFLA